MLKFPKGFGLGYGQKINKGEEGFIFPLLVVGANSFIRQKFSAQTLTNWEMHLFFFPNIKGHYTVGILGTERQGLHAILKVGHGNTINEAIDHAIKAQIEPSDVELKEHAMNWLNLSIYRCSKVALKDILSLEPSKKVA